MYVHFFACLKKRTKETAPRRNLFSVLTVSFHGNFKHTRSRRRMNFLFMKCLVRPAIPQAYKKSTPSAIISGILFITVRNPRAKRGISEKDCRLFERSEFCNPGNPVSEARIRISAGAAFLAPLLWPSKEVAKILFIIPLH